MTDNKLIIYEGVSLSYCCKQHSVARKALSSS